MHTICGNHQKQYGGGMEAVNFSLPFSLESSLPTSQQNKIVFSKKMWQYRETHLETTPRTSKKLEGMFPF